MSTLSETKYRDVNSEIRDKSLGLPWLRCGGCDNGCAISPFDDLRPYGVSCTSKPEDLNPDLH